MEETLSFRLHLLLAASLLSTNLHAKVRTLTSTAGTTIQGELVSVSGDMVTIKKCVGRLPASQVGGSESTSQGKWRR